MKNITKIKLLFLCYFLYLLNKKGIKKIGVIGVRHEPNIGNNLLKYAISIKLKELGFKPYIIGTHWMNYNINFLKKNTNCVIIKKSFKEIKRNKYDILMVNSDQTWRRFDEHFYDYGFLKFAETWNIPKFVYGASIGYNYWKFNQKEENIIKLLLKNFTGVSVREKGSIKLIEKHIGIKPKLVLDPTLLINKNYYLNLIKNYKSNINITEAYIFSYIISSDKKIKNYIQRACAQLKYKYYPVKSKEKNSIEKFIYGILHSKAIITNSFHGTIFSIIFNKPFITFIYEDVPKERFYSLEKLFGIKNRIVDCNEQPDINLLNTPLKINRTLIEIMKVKSIDFLKKNLQNKL